MIKVFIKNFDNFQGQKYLKKARNYFEGWYFKNTNLSETISFIPGVNINDKKKQAFIQVITNNKSYYFDYDIEMFEYGTNPFYIKIENNYFSNDRVVINIKRKNIKIKGQLKYNNNIKIATSILSPNIMGPFSYIPFMECNHAIISMKNAVDGYIDLNNKKIKFNRGIGYIEKDWGISFPKNYIWMQGNCFVKKNISFMLSIAHIPFKMFSFKGFICVFIIDDKEYRFTTYNNAKIIKCCMNEKEEKICVILKKGIYELKILSSNKKGNVLTAPIKGRMKRTIYESIDDEILVTLKEKNRIIFSGISTNCGLEIVK